MHFVHFESWHCMRKSLEHLRHKTHTCINHKSKFHNGQCLVSNRTMHWCWQQHSNTNADAFTVWAQCKHCAVNHSQVQWTLARSRKRRQYEVLGRRHSPAGLAVLIINASSKRPWKITAASEMHSVCYGSHHLQLTGNVLQHLIYNVSYKHLALLL